MLYSAKQRNCAISTTVMAAVADLAFKFTGKIENKNTEREKG